MAAYADAPLHVAPRVLIVVSGVAVVLNFALLGLLASEEPRTFAVWTGLVVLGGVYYLARAWQAATSGVPLVERLEEL